jgi:hypothetical protein
MIAEIFDFFSHMIQATCNSLSQLDWAAVATFCVVLVALYPIYKSYKRGKLQARKLRLQIGTKLLLIRPSLGGLLRPDKRTPDAELNSEQFQDIIRDINNLMSQPSTIELEPDELDQLAMTILNLNASAKLYNTPSLEKETVKNLLDLVDKSLILFESYGLTKKKKLEKPWAREDDYPLRVNHPVWCELVIKELRYPSDSERPKK